MKNKETPGAMRITVEEVSAPQNATATIEEYLTDRQRQGKRLIAWSYEGDGMYQLWFKQLITGITGTEANMLKEVDWDQLSQVLTVVPWQLVNFHGIGSRLNDKKGTDVTTVRLWGYWAEVMQVGDPVELFDMQESLPYGYCTVVALKKVKVKDLLPSETEFLQRAYGISSTDRKENMHLFLSRVYEQDVALDDIITVLTLRADTHIGFKRPGLFQRFMDWTHKKFAGRFKEEAETTYEVLGIN